MSQNVRAGTNKSSGFIIKFAAYSFAIFSIKTQCSLYSLLVE
jgi:hypothetical protein